jgi:AcrR family transcriptional regulator
MLNEVNKAERRGKILAAARKLISRGGVEALTLRDLAAAASVSVPTVYNLIGGRQAVLSALMGDTFTRIAARLGAANATGLVERALALCEAGWTELLAEPDYFRGIMRAFLVADENLAVRREVDAANVGLMAGILTLAQSEGELVDWCDPEVVARTLWAHYVVCMLGWASRDLSDEELPACATYGLSTILYGLARGEAQRKLEKLIRSSQAKAARAAHSKGARP